MRKIVLAAVAVIALAGCQSKHHVTPSPSASADLAQAQKIVQNCAAHANFLTKPGRKAFYACIAPPGKEAAVQACAGQAFARDGALTHTARVRFENDLARCIVR